MGQDAPDGATHKDEYGDFYIVKDGMYMIHHNENGWDGWYDDSIVRGQLIKLSA